MDSQFSRLLNLAVPSRLVVDGAQWDFVAVRADAVAVRLLFRREDLDFSIRIEPTNDPTAGDVRKAYARFRSVSVSHGGLPSAQLPDGARSAAIGLLNDICARVDSADRGNLGEVVKRLRRGQGPDDAERVSRVLRQLPGADSQPASRFIDAVVAGVANGEIPASVVEPSFRCTSRSFRVSVNATLIRDARSKTSDAWRRLCAGAQVPDQPALEMLASWLSSERPTSAPHHAYVGVALGADERRAKLYFHAAKAVPEQLQDLLRRIDVGSIDSIGVHADVHMLCADFDQVSGALLGVKAYSNGQGGDVVCARHDANGVAVASSVHRSVTMDGPQTRKWLIDGGDPELAAQVGQMIEDGLLHARVACDNPLRTLYTAVTMPRLHSLDHESG